MSINLDVDNDVDKLLEREQLPKRDRKPAGGSKKDAKKGPTRETHKTTKLQDHENRENTAAETWISSSRKNFENICAQNISH